MNPCFELLDLPIVRGQADELVLTDPAVTRARLLEDVAAVGGVLRAVGVESGGRVRVATSDERVGVTALLAVLRLGAVPSSVAEVSVEDRDAGPHLVWSGDTALDWTGVMKAGRTDPAQAYDGPLDAGFGWPDLDLPMAPQRLRSVIEDIVRALRGEPT